MFGVGGFGSVIYLGASGFSQAKLGGLGYHVKSLS